MAIWDGGIDWDAEALRAAPLQMWPAWAGPDCDYFRGFIRPQDRLMDLGCSTAQCYGIFRSIEPAIKYVGLDLSPVAIKIARERYPDAEFFLMNAKDMTFEEEFDVIFTHTFYQHNYRASKRIIVPKVYKALKKGGFHIIEENTSSSDEGCMFVQEYINFFESFGFKIVKTHDIGGGGTGFIFRK